MSTTRDATTPDPGGQGPRGDLSEYRGKRDFSRTGEPEGGEGSPGGEPVFVVQIHDARSLHFDFRLEVDGVLKSWAVPKGPSDEPQDKRLAMATEDHPLSYRDFEGVIAEEEYGGGTVIVWDEGHYQNLTADRSGHEVPCADGLRKGHISFRLDGSKLHGGYSLTRLRQGEDDAWLLVKRADGQAGRHHTPAPHRARSVRSRRTLKQVAEQAAQAERDTAGEEA